MSSTASSRRQIDPTAPKEPSGRVKGLTGSSSGGSLPPTVEDQPTVISRRSPIPASPVVNAAGGVASDQVGPGNMLGHFQLLEFIGGGGMGRVFRGLDTRLGRTVALKVLSSDQAADPETLARFRNEARSAARLSHSGIVQVYYVGEEDEAPFIALEYVDGVNIRDLVEQRGPLSLAESIHYTLQVAEVLAHAAERRVVHRDIKPSNVLVTPEGKTKLIDLGLARMQPMGGSASDLTASGVTLGTFDYISPEQARDPRNADVRSDIYSLGCTLFYMLAGRPPFPEGTVLQKLLQHQGDEPPDVRDFRPELPEEAARVVKRMMAKSPDRRYQDPARLIEALLLLADQVGLQSLGSGQMLWVAPHERPASFVRQNLPWMVPVGALIAVAIVLHFVWSPSSSSDAGVPGRPEASRELPEEYEDLLIQDSLVGEPPPPTAQAAGPQTPETEAAVADGTEMVRNTVEGDSGNAESSPETEAAGTPGDSAARPGPPQLAPGKDESMRPGSEAVDPSGGAGGGASSPASSPSSNDSLPSKAAPLATPPGAAAPEVQSASDSNTLEGTLSGAPRQGVVLVVDPSGQTEGGFSSLGAAFARASSGDVIELHYSGRPEQQGHALAAVNLEVTVRPGRGFEPVVVYQPKLDPIKYPHSMFALTGSQLTFENIAMELDVPPDVPADEWSMFQMTGKEGITLRRCSLTVRNPLGHPDVAFFRLRSPPGSGMGLGDAGTTPPRRAELSLTNCVIRGESVVLCVEDLLAVDLAWENGLLVTTEQLLRADGGDKAPQADEQIRVDLKRVTAVVRGGLCRWTDTSFAPHQLPARISSSWCVFLGNGSAPVATQETAAGAHEATARITWRGQRNCYNGFADFCVVRPVDPAGEPKVWSLEDWLSSVDPEAEIEPSTEPVPWLSLPGSERPVYEHSPGDYLIFDSTSVAETVEGLGVGCQQQLLPSLR